MHVIKATGLVPVKAKVAIDNFSAGTVFGMWPDDARRALKSGFVELYPVPNDVDVDTVAGPVAEDETVKEPVGDDLIEIPEDWASQHHLARMSLAKKISGKDLPKATDEQKLAGVSTVDLADEIIKAELERRAAAESKPEE